MRSGKSVHANTTKHTVTAAPTGDGGVEVTVVGRHCRDGVASTQVSPAAARELAAELTAIADEIDGGKS